MKGRELIKEGIRHLAREASGTGKNPLGTFIGEKVSRADQVEVLLLDNHGRAGAQVTDPTDPDWGLLIPIEGIDF